MFITSAQIAQMSPEEKLQTMEALWADLSRTGDNVESPPWHKDVLEETNARFDAGKERVLDWDDAKKKLRKRVE
ncbi:MAG: addiction module protein [Candidatus Hydrogenedentes bacterium]|nr:addiction module protein [Candidatus Hydrogenedentota bacterium]